MTRRERALARAADKRRTETGDDQRPHRGTKKALVLLSGGADSATCLMWALREGYRPHCLTFDYGQLAAEKELLCAEALAKRCRADWEFVELPWGAKSSLTGHGALPAAGGAGIPSTFVPGRNMLFLAYGIARARALGCSAVIIGANAVDYSGYPDCRPVFLLAMQSASDLALGEPVRILAPLIDLSKREIGDLARELCVPIEETTSCYQGTDCGSCDACALRLLLLL